MAFGDVIRFAASPTAKPAGIGGDADTIWHCETLTDRIYELSTTDFSVVRFAAGPVNFATGIGGDANTIWHCDVDADKVYELSTTDFSVVRSAASPEVQPWGIGGDADTIWHCVSRLAIDKVYELSTTDFSVVRDAAGPFTYPRGIGGDANTIWHSDADKDRLYELSTTDFSVVRFAAPPTTFPRGIGGGADTIWFCESINGRIYELSTGITLPTCTTLAPEIRWFKPTEFLFKGQVDDDGGEACEYRFQYGPTVAYGTNTDWTGAVETGDDFEETLEPRDWFRSDELVHYRAQLKNAAGIGSGADADGGHWFE